MWFWKICSGNCKEGYDVTGFDLSEEMLSLAYQHSYEENIELTLVAGDVDLSGLKI